MWRREIIKLLSLQQAVASGVLIFLALGYLRPVKGIKDGIHLVNMKSLKCLAVEPGTLQLVTSVCDENDLYQKWQWISTLNLRNIGSNKCIRYYSIDPRFRMYDCISSQIKQKITCSFNTLILSQNLIGAMDNGKVYHFTSSKNARTRWKTSTGDEVDSICNVTNNRDWPKWVRFQGGMKSVDSGLSRWIVTIKENDEIVRRDSVAERKTHQIIGGLIMASIAPNAVWGINSAFYLYVGNPNFELGSFNAHWELLSGTGYKLLDFSMPGKGFVVNNLGQFCARLGITYENAKGSSWQCASDGIEPSSLSCGVTGCYAIRSDEVYYRVGINDTNPVGTAWVLIEGGPLMLFNKIAAGPSYKLWATITEGYVYRRIGVTDQNPTGHAWEQVPDVLLVDINIGIFGPIGILEGNELVTMNGSPTPQRQREMDKHCETIVPKCVSGTSGCVTSGDQCHARYVSANWRCYMQEALDRSGQMWNRNSNCYYSRHDPLKSLALKSPVLGSFEKQMWLDQTCNDPYYNTKLANASWCWYYADFDAKQNSFVCRSAGPDVACPTVREIGDHLSFVTTASCGQIPLGSPKGPLPDSAFSATSELDGRMAFHARLSGGSAWCARSSNLTEAFLELDFRYLHKICAVATQAFDNKFVRSYKLQYSSDHASWKYSTLFGTTMEFRGSLVSADIIKHFLPAAVETRFLRFRPTSVSPLNFCLKIEVYGSSKETEANSCEYYRTHLFATQDGLYTLYSNETSTKRSVYCKDIPPKAILLDENDPKFYWPMNAIEDEGDTLLTFRDRTGVGVFQNNRSKILGDFTASCISDPDFCPRGLTVELWLHFSAYSLEEETVVLQSGFRDSRGFTLYTKDQRVCFEVRGETTYWTSCQDVLAIRNRWLHVVASWAHATGLVVIVDDPASIALADASRRSNGFSLADLDNLLRLGSPSGITHQESSVAINSLSIWMRRLEPDEIDALFRSDDFMLGDMGETCSIACRRKGISCYPVMGSNITFVLNDLGIRCGSKSSFVYHGINQPLVDSHGNCFGFHGLPTEMCCSCFRADVRRMCRCKEPVNGSFSEWSAGSFCSRSCGSGRRMRFRTCTDPSPSFGGKECEGSFTMMEECHQRACDDTSGVLREIWLGSDTDFKQIPGLKMHPTFPSYPSYTETLEALESPSTSISWNHYGERLRTYFRPPSSGQYTFTVNCTQSCVLLLRRGVAQMEEIVNLASSMVHDEDYFKFPSMFQTSVPQQLTDTETYQLEALHVNYLGPSYLAVGLWLNTGASRVSISNKHFTWKQDPQGISREIWTAPFQQVSDFQAHLASSPTPLHQDVLWEFATDQNFGDNYGQRLRTFFLAPSYGSYTFEMYCSDKCELWFSDGANIPSKIIDFTDSILWNKRWVSAKSEVKNLDGGEFYYLEVLHVETTGSDFLGVGITLPDGTTLHPINKIYLWREKPGNIAFERGPAYEASLYGDWVAERAVDGSLVLCTHTNPMTDPWFLLDMTESVTVTSVAVTNRGGYESRLDDFEIRVGNSFTDHGAVNPKCTGPNPGPLKTMSFACIGQPTGRYLSVHIYGDGRTLTICELAVYGLIEEDGTYGQGLSDGRMEDYTLTASSSQDLSQYARLYHPFKSWCAVPKLTITFKIWFPERIYIKAVATQGNPLEEEWVTKYRLKVESKGRMVGARNITGNQELIGNVDSNTVVVNRLMETMQTKYVILSPLQWHGRPCLRLEIYGKDVDTHYLWYTNKRLTTLGAQFSGNKTLLKKPVENVLLSNSSQLRLFGFNIPCLINPRSCLRDVRITMRISLVETTGNGFLFTTTDYDPSALGFSLFVKNQEIVAIVRTETRVWKAAGPVQSVVNNFDIVRIIWAYDKKLTLVIGSKYFYGKLVLAEHVGRVNEPSSTVIKVGGSLDFSIVHVAIHLIEMDESEKMKMVYSVDSIYSSWTSWSYCSKSCGNDSVQTRVRRCDNPVQFQGRGCLLQEYDYRSCFLPYCEDNDGVLHEVWLDRSQHKFSLKNVTDGSPSHLEVVHNFSQYNVSHGNFGQTFRTFLLAKRTGSFIFKLSCSFQCDLWMSPNDEPEDKVMLLSIDEEKNSYGSGVVREVIAQRVLTLRKHFYVEVRSFEIKDGEKVPLLTIVLSNSDSLGIEDGYVLVRHKPDRFHGLGMESGAIHDEQISSFLYESDHPSSHFGRLNDHHPWCVGEENDKILTVDLIDLHWVVGIAIQGYNKEHWVSSLTIHRRLAVGILPVLADVEESLLVTGNEDANTTIIVTFDRPLRVRYVVVEPKIYQGLGCLRLELIGHHAGNLATGKHAEQSQPEYNEQHASNSNDGVFSRIGGGRKGCAHTESLENPFWSIDLVNSFYISEILILQRDDCCRDRLHNFEVRIGNTSATSGVLNPRCGQLYSMASSTAMVIRCEPYSYGRYLIISIPGTSKILTLCEVSIFQIENDTVMSNWSECSVTCGEGVRYRQSICIKPYYCKSVRDTRPCVAEKPCKILMQNCRQLELKGHNDDGPYLVRPNPELENKTWVYCNQGFDGGWLVIQRRYGYGLDFDQSWDSYKNGFGNISTEFWIGNDVLHQLTRDTAYEVLILFEHGNGTARKTGCDFLNVSTEADNYRLVLGHCLGSDAQGLSSSNLTAFSTRDVDRGLGGLSCERSLVGGWWYGSCDSLKINGEFPSCSGAASCDETKMLIRPKKVDGGWSHWTSWGTCDKPCGGGNSIRLRSCTEPPPGYGGSPCEGISNKTQGCFTHPCRDVELNLTLRFTMETWNPALQVLSSSAHRKLLEKISRNIKSLYDNESTISVFIRSFRQGSVFADIGIVFSAVDEQQLVVLQEDLDQDGLLNQDMPVVYDYNDFTISTVPFEPPEVAELRNTSSTSIYIAWTPPNSTSIQASLVGYRIYYKKQKDPSLLMLTESLPASATETEIENLETFTNYTVRLCVFSSSGNGLPSIAYYVITDEDVPSQAPGIIMATNISSTSLYLEWQVIDEALFHGRPLGYTLYYRIKNTTAIYSQSIDGHLSTNTTISGLMKYTHYEVFMTARTKKGDGIQGRFMNLTTDEDVPSQPPRNVKVQNKTSSSITLSWLPITRRWIHGVLQGYVITFWPLDNINEIQNATTQLDVIELQELRKFSNYSISIAGMTSKGAGNRSEIIAATEEDVPLRGPSNLTGYSVTANEINISWRLIPREYVQGNIKGYRVYYDDELRHSGNVSMSSSQTQLLLGGLMSYTHYNISVVGFTKVGEGPRTSVSIRTHKGAPSRTLWDLTCPSESAYTISIQWFPFTPQLTGSQLTGYAMSYRVVVPPGPPVNLTLPSSLKSYTLEKLKGFTQYSIEMFVFNDLGRSNTLTILCSTEDGKPLASPANVKAISKVGPDKIFVEWDHVPKPLVSGIRRGYTIIYRKVTDVGVSVLEKEQKFDVFDPDQKEALLEGLVYYAQYSIKVRVFNRKMFGDQSEPVYAETCNCLRHFYINWCSYTPYVNTSHSGIFPPLVRSMIVTVCGNCLAHQTTIHFDRDYRGYDARKSSLVDVRQSISKENQVSFPVSARKDGISSKSVSFLPVIHSPGSVFVTKKPQLQMAISYGFSNTIMNTLPLLGFSILTALLAGIVMWCLESKTNNEHFPKRFTRGVPEGFWWSFISMTTVGYGDRAPVTICGRLFAIMWTLYGLVITGLVVGNLTASLSASVAITFSDVDLYQSQIGALENSSEFKLGMAKGAHVNTAKNFSNISSVLDGVKVGIVDGALLDMYVVASLPGLQRKDSPLMVKAIIPNPSTYGIILSGHTRKLERVFAQYLGNNAAFVSRILEENTRPVEAQNEEENSAKESDELTDDINVLGPDSPVIHKPLLYSSIFLAIAVMAGLVLHFTLCKRRRKADKSNSVYPVADVAEQLMTMKACLQEFCECFQTKIKDLKLKHKYELIKLHSGRIKLHLR